MAEAIIGVVAENLLDEALSLTTEEFNLCFGFKSQLRSLADELEIIQALVADADTKNIQSTPMQPWFKRLKAVMFDAEDVLEVYKYELVRQTIPQTKWDKVRNFYSPVRNLAFRHKMAHKIKGVNFHLRSVIDQGKRYGLNASKFLNNSSEVRMDRVMTSPSIQESEIVGRDDDVKKVVDMLVNSNDEESVALIAIVGMGGQGKTTVAQLVCKHDKVVSHFEKIIWVCVSDDFKIERLLNEMVESITLQDSNLTSRQALIGKLQETLKGERYLLVFDDVWNEDQQKWELMRNDLLEINGSRGTKILVTTRSAKVVSTMHASQTHNLSKLSDNDSWSLFKKRAFVEGGVVETPEFVTVGQGIIKRCGGVPLAIKALGGLLYSKKDVGEWLNIEKSHLWSSTEDEGGVMSSIKLSYNHLPSLSLKQCFAYCSIFPEDMRMERDALIQQWMAHGFLNPPKGTNLQMEDLGRTYYDTLLWNSLLQEPFYDKVQQAWFCKMHDIVHDFALDISKSYCFTIKVNDDHNDIDQAAHISVMSREKEIIDIPQGISSKIRTLCLPSRVKFNENAVLRFGYLRTLILSSLEVRELPTSIGRLKLLRYLDIKDTQVTKLPPSYINLYNLQVLRLTHILSQTNLYVHKLVNLRHIFFDLSHYRVVKQMCILVGIKQLVHLQTLTHFRVTNEEGSKIEELGPINNLRGALRIYGLEKVKNGEEAQKANIWKKINVDRLEFHWEAEGNCEDVLEGLRPHSYLKSLKIEYFNGSRFPSWMSMANNGLLNNLMEVILQGCYSPEQLPPLGHLPHLKIVEICSLNNVKCIGEEFYGCTINLNSINIAFPALEKLEIYDMENLEEWLGAEHLSPSLRAFPHLRNLMVYRCFKLTDLPSLQGLASLARLSIAWNKKLNELPRGIQSCTSLETIQLKNNGAFQRLDGYGIEYLPNLTKLELGAFSKMLDYFPLPHDPRITNSEENREDDHLYFGSLKTLHLSGWSRLTTLPEWCCNIQSLSSLKLIDCDKLKYIASAEAMQRLTNLQLLKISGCPLLKERCTKGSGPEWHKIAHIPKVEVYG